MLAVFLNNKVHTSFLCNLAKTKTFPNDTNYKIFERTNER